MTCEVYRIANILGPEERRRLRFNMRGLGASMPATPCSSLPAVDFSWRRQGRAVTKFHISPPHFRRHLAATRRHWPPRFASALPRALLISYYDDQAITFAAVRRRNYLSRIPILAHSRIRDDFLPFSARRATRRIASVFDCLRYF